MKRQRRHRGYWAGAAGMITGIVVIGAFVRTSRREDISHGVLHLFVCVVGLFAYYSLVVDRTAIHAGDRIFYLSHYLYWILRRLEQRRAVPGVGPYRR